MDGATRITGARARQDFGDCSGARAGGIVYPLETAGGKGLYGKPGQKKDPNQQAPEIALRLLARREHSRFELTMKLRQRRVDARVIEDVLDDFEDKGWLSDDRFAEVFVRQRMDAGYGPLKILADLQQRGINRVPSELDVVPDSQWVARGSAEGQTIRARGYLR